jgi:tRNA G18 (ribose-2'-O)-methylase SpoU/glycosyltransferase involved in cell wall biosynthesis
VKTAYIYEKLFAIMVQRVTTRVRLIVMDFVSHCVWAEGYAKAAAETAAGTEITAQDEPQQEQQIKVHVQYISAEKWKWRLQSGAVAELYHHILDDVDKEGEEDNEDDIWIVDGMLDLTLIAALWGQQQQQQQQSSLSASTATMRRRRRRRRPRLFLYLHENQFTTPFAPKDRDVKNNTHWHYGMAHYRSLFVADGFIFNSHQQLQVFSNALPNLIQQQCPHGNDDKEGRTTPKNTLQWHLQKAKELVATKCTVLHYGLPLQELVDLLSSTITNHNDNKNSSETLPPPPAPPPAVPPSSLVPSSPTPVVILWNARLEPDKDPETFLYILQQLQQQYPHLASSFQLIVLGSDTTKDQKWYTRIRKQFSLSSQLVFMGWCTDRQEYVQWLSKADIVLSTALHETFGIAIVEAVYVGGGIPLLPHRLSYPEIFSPPSLQSLASTCFYTSTNDCVTKLAALIQLVQQDDNNNNKERRQTIITELRQVLQRFDWSIMGPVYNNFFHTIAKGGNIVEAGKQANTLAMSLTNKEQNRQTIPQTMKGTQNVVLPPLDSTDEKSLPQAQEQQPSIQKFTISEPNDPRVALYRPKSLRHHQVYRTQLQNWRNNETGVEPVLHGGRRAMMRLLEAISEGARVRILSFLTTHELAENTVWMEKLERAGIYVPLYVTTKSLLNDIRGQKLNAGDAILAMLQFPIQTPSLEDLIASPPILVLDNVRNADNIGSILRTAFCLGITSVVASTTAWAALKDSRSARCSMGTMYYHKFYKAESLEDCIAEIQAGGITVYGIEIGPEARPIQPHGTDRRWAAVLGNEDLGMSAAVRQKCNNVVFIPQFHGDSLNVGHAAAISLFELGREAPRPHHDGKAACP